MPGACKACSPVQGSLVERRLYQLGAWGWALGSIQGASAWKRSKGVLPPSASARAGTSQLAANAGWYIIRIALKFCSIVVKRVGFPA